MLVLEDGVDEPSRLVPNLERLRIGSVRNDYEDFNALILTIASRAPLEDDDRWLRTLRVMNYHTEFGGGRGDAFNEYMNERVEMVDVFRSRFKVRGSREYDCKGDGAHHALPWRDEDEYDPYKDWI